MKKANLILATAISGLLVGCGSNPSKDAASSTNDSNKIVNEAAIPSLAGNGNIKAKLEKINGDWRYTEFGLKTPYKAHSSEAIWVNLKWGTPVKAFTEEIECVPRKHRFCDTKGEYLFRGASVSASDAAATAIAAGLSFGLTLVTGGGVGHSNVFDEDGFQSAVNEARSRLSDEQIQGFNKAYEAYTDARAKRDNACEIERGLHGKFSGKLHELTVELNDKIKKQLIQKVRFRDKTGIASLNLKDEYLSKGKVSVDMSGMDTSRLKQCRSDYHSLSSERFASLSEMTKAANEFTQDQLKVEGLVKERSANKLSKLKSNFKRYTQNVSFKYHSASGHTRNGFSLIKNLPEEGRLQNGKVIYKGSLTVNDAVINRAFFSEYKHQDKYLSVELINGFTVRLENKSSGFITIADRTMYVNNDVVTFSNEIRLPPGAYKDITLSQFNFKDYLISRSGLNKRSYYAKSERFGFAFNYTVSGSSTSRTLYKQNNYALSQLKNFW